MVDSLDFDGVSTDLLNIFDFPLEDVEVGAEKDDWNDIQLLDLPSDISMGLSSVFSSGLQNQIDCSKDNKNLSVTYDRTCRLSQLPSAAETTSSGGALLSDDSNSDVKHTHLFKTSSPVSILESSSSCFAENPRPADQKSVIPVKRARSKRCTRPSNFDRLCTLPFISVSERLEPSAASESDSGPIQVGKMFKPAKRVPKKKKVTSHPGVVEMRNFSDGSGETKRCTHCQVTTTPQWREGPMGPKTLCNACGVRYRSGRLFPEYRPAASPTFVPSLHSNSHKKVIEMRNKAGQRANSSRAGVELCFRPQAGNSVRQLIV